MNYTTTTNGAITNQTSGKECLDLFTRIGNMRYEDRLRILEEFDKAYQDDKQLATQVLFWAREKLSTQFYGRLGRHHQRLYQIMLVLLPS